MQASPPVLTTARLVVRMATYQDVAAIADYYRQNRAFLTPFEPTRSQDFFTEFYWQVQVERNLIEFEHQQSLRLFLFEKSRPETVIGVANFNQLFRGSFQACVLGYGLAETQQGKGYMQEALSAAIDYVFTELNLHRITANYMPRNQRSGNLLKRLGFVIEGYARDYLLINGQWEDHLLSSLINPNWHPDIS